MVNNAGQKYTVTFSGVDDDKLASTAKSLYDTSKATYDA